MRRAPAGPGGRPRAQPEARDQVDRRRGAEEHGEPGLLHEGAVRGARDRGELGHRVPAGCGRLERPALEIPCGREERRRRDLLEVALGDRRVGVVGGDDLALLGELEAPVHGSRGLGEDRAVRGTAAAADGAAAAVEQGEPDVVPAGGRDQRLLRLVQEPVRREEAALLGRVGVAEHDLLGVAAVAEVGPVGGIREQPVDELAGARERLRGLEERNDVEDGHRGGEVGEHLDRPAERLRLGGAPGELEHVGHVRRAGRERDHVALAGRDPQAPLEARDRTERREHLAQRHAARDLDLRPGPGVERRDRRPVDGGVLTDLERREVEAERRRPASAGPRARRAPRGPGRRRRARPGRRPAPRRARPGPRIRPSAARSRR